MFRWLNNSNKGRLGNVNSFIIYYGTATPEAKSRLSQVNIAIIEPRQWPPTDLAELRASGTRIWGYLSVMETPVWNTKRSALISEADILSIHGKPIRFEEWNSTLMDLRSVRYRIILLEEIAELSAIYALDGILLDTVGDIEEFVPEAMRRETSEAYRVLLSTAAGRFPLMKWIQNRGFDQLSYCADLIDGFLWEGWNGHDDSTGWTKIWLKVLSHYQRNGLSVLSVTADPDPIHRKTAEKHGFIHWTNPGIHYNSL